MVNLMSVLFFALVLSCASAQVSKNETTVGLGDQCCAHFSVCTAFPHCDEGLYCDNGGRTFRPGHCRQLPAVELALASPDDEAENETPVGLGQQCCAHINLCTRFPHCEEGLYCSTGEMTFLPGRCHRLPGAELALNLNRTAAEGEPCCFTNSCHDSLGQVYPGCQKGLWCYTREATWKPGYCKRVPVPEEFVTKAKTGAEGEQCCMNNNMCTTFEGCQEGLFCHTGEATWMPGHCKRVPAPEESVTKAKTGAEGEQCCMNNNLCTGFEGCQEGLYCHTGEATWLPGRCRRHSVLSQA